MDRFNHSRNEVRDAWRFVSGSLRKLCEAETIRRPPQSRSGRPNFATNIRLRGTNVRRNPNPLHCEGVTMDKLELDARVARLERRVSLLMTVLLLAAAGAAITICF